MYVYIRFIAFTRITELKFIYQKTVVILSELHSYNYSTKLPNWGILLQKVIFKLFPVAALQ